MTKKIFTMFLSIALATVLSIPAMAAEFTSSVEAKPAPEIVAQTDSKGNECAAIIYDAEGKEVTGVPSGDLIVTPVSADSAPSPEIKEKLEAAYEQIRSVSSLTELSEELEPVIKEVSPSLTVDDLVVRDMFDVTVSGTYADYLSQEGHSISIRFNLSADANSLAAVLHNIAGSTWETVSNDRITRNSNRTADVVFYELSPVAFLFDSEKLNIDPNAPASPQTGEPESYGIPWIAGGIMIAAIATYGIFRKRSTQKV